MRSIHPHKWHGLEVEIMGGYGREISVDTAAPTLPRPLFAATASRAAEASGVSLPRGEEYDGHALRPLPLCAFPAPRRHAAVVDARRREHHPWGHTVRAWPCLVRVKTQQQPI